MEQARDVIALTRHLSDEIGRQVSAVQAGKEATAKVKAAVLRALLSDEEFAELGDLARAMFGLKITRQHYRFCVQTPGAPGGQFFLRDPELWEFTQAFIEQSPARDFLRALYPDPTPSALYPEPTPKAE